MICTSDYIEKTAKGTIIVFISLVVSALFGYFTRIYLAQNLSVQDYGLFYAIFALISLLILIQGFGLYNSLIKFIPEFIVKGKTEKIKAIVSIAAIIQISTSIIVIALIVLFSGQLTSFFKYNAAIDVISILLVYTLLYSLFTLLRSLFRAYNEMMAFAVSALLYSLLIFLFTVLLFSSYGSSLNSVAYSYVLSVSIVVAVFSVFLIKKIGNLFTLKIKNYKELLKMMFIFSIPVFLTGIINNVITYADTLTITLFRTFEEVGLYQVAMPTAQLLLFIPIAIGAILFPLISEMWAKKQYNYISKGMELITRLSLVLIIPLALVFIAFPETVLNLLFGPKYIPAAPALQILSIGFIFASLGTTLMVALNAVGKPVSNTKTAIIVVLINITLNIILVPRIGIMGSAVAVLVSYIIFFIISYKYLSDELRIKNIIFTIPSITIIKIFIGGVLALFIMFLLKSVLEMNPLLEAIIITASAVLLYILWIFKTKCITKEDIELFYKSKIPVPKPIRYMLNLLAKD